MNTLQKTVITLVKSAILGEKLSLSEECDLEQILKIANKHQISTIIYYGAVNCGVDSKNAEMAALFTKTCENLAVSNQQDYHIKSLFKKFDIEKIEYMPLKGSLLRKLYPKGEMRIMGDADILIKTEQYDRIRPIMEALGYTEKLESDHELVWYKKGMLIELHKRLIPSYNKDYYAYFGDGWQLSQKTDTSRYEMTNDDNMIYLFTHFAKHYRDAGIGIRHIVDLWVYRNKYKDLNEEYIKEELKKLKLYDFYLNIIKTINAWFCGGECDEIIDFITEVIFSSGVYGRKENHDLSATLKVSKGSSKKVARFIKLWKEIFLPLNLMKKQYPILEKAAILLPFMWIARIFRTIFFRGEKIKNKSEVLKNTSAEKIENYENSLQFVGLDFNFKE